MCRRARPLFLVFPLLCACHRPETTDSIPGRLRVELDGRAVLDAPATASRCAADTTIAVTAMGVDRVAAISLRMPWLSDSGGVLTVASPPPPPGAASVALRTLGDSAGPALLGVRGSVRLDPGRVLNGLFDVVAPTLPGAPDSAHLTGSFSGVVVNDDLCPGPATP